MNKYNPTRTFESNRTRRYYTFISVLTAIFLPLHALPQSVNQKMTPINDQKEVSARRIETMRQTIDVLCSSEFSDRLDLDTWRKQQEESASDTVDGLPPIPPPIIDIGINTQGAPDAQFFSELLRAKAAGVEHVVFTGTDSKRNRLGWTRVREWKALVATEESQQQDQHHLHLSRRIRSILPTLHYTAGVHPHQADQCHPETLSHIEHYVQDGDGNAAVAVGECGLDYDRMRSPRQEQLQVFRSLVDMSARLQVPLFVHERDRDSGRKEPPLGCCNDLCGILDDYCGGETPKLDPDKVCIHCFTGGQTELDAYVSRGYWIGLTGFICMEKRGAKLRQLISDGHLPLDRIMIETDAPYMRGDNDYYVPQEMKPPIVSLTPQEEKDNEETTNEKKNSKSKSKRRRSSKYTQPGDVAAVARALAELLGVPYSTVCQVTTANAKKFFRLE